MDEILTWAEIERRFPDEWVVIDEPEVTDAVSLRGLVVFHGPDRDEASAAVKRLGLRHVAVWFAGPLIPEGTVAIL